MGKFVLPEIVFEAIHYMPIMILMDHFDFDTSKSQLGKETVSENANDVHNIACNELNEWAH